MNKNYDGKRKREVIPPTNPLPKTERELEREAFLSEMDKRYKKEWSDVTEWDLLEMYEEGNLIDGDIADYYGVSVEAVRRKKRRFNISSRDIILGQVLRKVFNNEELKPNDKF